MAQTLETGPPLIHPPGDGDAAASKPGPNLTNITMKNSSSNSQPSSPSASPSQSPTKDSKPLLTIDRRTTLSKRMRLIQASMKPFRPRAVQPGKITHELSPRLTPHKKALQRCDVEESQGEEGIWVYRMVPKKEKGGMGQFRRLGSGKENGKTKTATNGSADGSADGSPRKGGGKKHVYYFAGGGWRMPPSRDHWAFAAELVCQVPNTCISMISYPLAPEYPAHESLPRLKVLYESMLAKSRADGERVIMAGDSSGGNIALCLTLWSLSNWGTNSKGENLRDSGIGDEVIPPTAVFGISPSTDLRHLNPRIEEVGKHDPILTEDMINETANTWCFGYSAGDKLKRPHKHDHKRDHDTAHHADQTNDQSKEWPLSDPRVSPILADLENLVRYNVQVHGINGTNDVLAPEAMVFRDRLKEVGVRGRWLQWDGQMHCFPLAFTYGLRESAEAVKWIVDVLKDI